MADDNQKRDVLTRTVATGVVICALLTAVDQSDVLSPLTREAVVRSLQLVGVTASNDVSNLSIGKVTIPWSRDCAGLNILTVLVALTLWINRKIALSRAWWCRLAAVVPIAFVVNVLRIHSLVAYRHLFFPEVESLELHFALGFFWMVLFLPLVVPRDEQSRLSRCVETLALAIVLALLAPHASAPGGTLVSVCTLLALLDFRMDGSGKLNPRLALPVWGLIGFVLVAMKMESSWIPWLLICPLLVPRKQLFSWARIGLLFGTIPVLSMHESIAMLLWLVVAWSLWQAIQCSGRHFDSTVTHGCPKRRLADGFVGLLLFLPFVGNLYAAESDASLPPPRGVIRLSSTPKSHRIMLLGQRPGLEVFWFEPQSQDRHHCLEVCMGYRGIDLKDTEYPGVMSDGDKWYREFYYQGQEFIGDYRRYVRRTLVPFSHPGAHIVIAASKDGMAASEFDTAAHAWIDQLEQL